MKKIIAFLILIILIGFESKAQVINCGSLCIQSIAMDTTNNELDVTIINADSNQINYPVVVVVNSTGDTVANISALYFLFAQLGGDTVTHDLPTTLDSLPANFTGTVYVTDAIYDTTCAYSFPMNCSTLNVAEISANNSVIIFPNPAIDFTTLNLGNTSGRQVGITLHDVTGRELRSFFTTESILTIEKENLSSGIYFISILIDNERITKKIIFE
jgi:serine protease AprX